MPGEVISEHSNQVHVASRENFHDNRSSCDTSSVEDNRRSPGVFSTDDTKISDFQSVCQVIPQQDGNQPFIIQLVQNANGGGVGSSHISASAPLAVQSSVKEDEPLYVNAKQYNRILKRRLTRAKLEQQGLIPKERRKYLHESRHKHALKRQRGEGGKFDSAGSFSEDAASPKEERVKSPDAITAQVKTVFRPASCEEESPESLKSDSV
ncbi:hypothetical protein L596_003443 [Steinernema carpocapsae]|uniref:Nuclear transcription factor Y subunit n=1 Tax=Steinernema carpocapsae TaxID=34508 RepID=A0A4U8UVP0_STECR|nr:hypothetical protein L596_003443 [Steinernema carpocapsae]